MQITYQPTAFCRLGGVVALFFLPELMLAQLGGGATPACLVDFSLQNQNRMVFGAVNTECPPTIHSIPFGNWGVDSLYGRREDGGQFQGWCQNNHDPQCPPVGDARMEWNSCTTQEPEFRAPNCFYYNYNACYWQRTVTGGNHYANNFIRWPAACPFDSDNDGLCDTGGCLKWCQVGLQPEENYMELYEHDPPFGRWDLVARLNYPAQIARSASSTMRNCSEGFSNWVINLHNGIAEADMRIWIRGGQFEFGGCSPACFLP